MKACWNPLATFGLICVFLCGVECVVFDSEPEDQTHTFESGSALTVSFYLDCKVSYLGANRKVSWFKDGVIVSDGYRLRSDLEHLIDVNRYSMKHHGAPDSRFGLVVNDISASTAAFDSGQYRCAVTRKDDVVVADGKSRTAELAVYVTPGAIYPVCRVSDLSGRELPTDRGEVRPVRAGESLKMTCESGPSTPDADLFWSLDQHGVSEQFESVRGGDILTSEYIWSARPDDGNVNVFTCTLRHPGLHSNRTCDLFFNVEYKPVVTMDRTQITITDAAEPVSIKCDQTSNPSFTNVTWYYDSYVINDDDRFSIRGLSLNISRLSARRNNGNHTVTCEVTNTVGTGSASAALTVQIPPPSFTGLPEKLLSGRATLIPPQSPSTPSCRSCPHTGKVGSGAPACIGSPQLLTLSWVLCCVWVFIS